MLRRTLLVLLALGLAGCGGRHLPTEHRDAAVADGTHRDGTSIPDGFYNPACAKDDDCRVAVRTDNCCESAYPEKVWIVDFDPCLEYWSAYGAVSVPEECLDRWDPQCAYVDCMPGPPPSRVARCDQGHCEFALECNDPSACMLVLDVRECCPCPTAVPRALYQVDPCLTKYPQDAFPPEDCYPQACPAMPCQECPVPTSSCRDQTCVGLLPER